MKKTLFSLAVSLFFLSCQKDIVIKGVVIDTSVEISLVDKATNKDLLNPSEENHYAIKKIEFEFGTPPNVKTNITGLQYTQPILFQKNNKYYLRFFPALLEPLTQKHHVIIHWSDTDKDIFTFYLRQEKPNVFTEKILLNDELKWDMSKGDREITLLK